MQRIDFYQAEFRPSQQVLPFRRMLVGLAATLVLMSGAIAAQEWMLASVMSEHRVITTMQQRQEAVVAQLTGSLATMKVSPALQSEVESLRVQIANQQRLFASLQQQSDSHSVSFAADLQALSDQHLTGISVADVELSQGGAALRLEGIAVDADRVPAYVDQLKQAEALRRYGFDEFELKPLEQRATQVYFTLGRLKEGKP